MTLDDVRCKKTRFGWIRAAACAIALASAAAHSVLACSAERPAVSDTESPIAPRLTPTNPCTHDGVRRACHVALPQRGSVRSCFVGTQVCNGGLWSPCGAPEASDAGLVTLSTVVMHDGVTEDGTTANGRLANDTSVEQPPMVTTKSLSDGSADSSACTVNPCDPTCVGFTEVPPDGGITSGAETTASYFAIPFTGTVPAGFFGKGMIDCAQNGVPCQDYVDGKFAACQFDSICKPGACSATDASSGSCLQYAEKQALPTTACAGPNLTAGIPCTDNTTNEPGMTFTICNRGSTPTVASTTVGVDFFGGASSNFPPPPGCTKNPSPDCKVVVPPLKVGGCVSIRSSSMLAGSKSLSTCRGNLPVGGGPAGNATVVINSDQALAECALLPSPYSVGGAATIYKGCDDNWTDLHKSGGLCVAYGKIYSPVVYSQTYTAACPPATRPHWAFLSYDVTTPTSGGTSSTAKFEVRSAPKTVDGGVGAYTAFAQAAFAPTLDPSVCPLGGPAPCPKDLYGALNNAAGGTNDVLDLRVTLTPSVDLSIAPTLKGWQVTYSCPPSE